MGLKQLTHARGLGQGWRNDSTGLWQDNIPEYTAWLHANQRCHDPKNPSWKDYGGRGIKVCARWRNSFRNFLVDMGKKPSSKHTIDRIDNNKSYSPENCRWATYAEQNRNHRRNHLITFNGKTQPLIDWAKETGLSPTIIEARLRKLKWSVSETLTTPKIEPLEKKQIRFNGQTKSLQEWSEQIGIALAILKRRLTNKWSIEKTLTTPFQQNKSNRKAVQYA